MSALDNILKAVKKATSSAAKTVVGKTLKSGAKAVQLAAKPLSKAPIVGSSVGKAANQISSEADRTAAKTDKATDQIANTLANVGSGAFDASKGMYTGQLKSMQDMAKAISQGDIKATAAGGLEGWDSMGDAFTDIGKGGASAAGNLVGAAGTATGNRDLSRSGENISREGSAAAQMAVKPGMEATAGVMTGGASTGALMAARAMADQGLAGAVTDPNWKNMAMGMAASQAGIPVEALQGGMTLAQGGSVKDAALQGGASYAGMTPEAARMAQAGAQGDLKGAASNLTYGGYNMGNVGQAKDLMQGKLDTGALKGMALQQASSYAGDKYKLTPEQMQAVNAGKDLATGSNAQDMLMGAAGNKMGLSQQQMSLGQSALKGDLKDQIGNNMDFGSILGKLNSSSLAQQAIGKLGVDPQMLSQMDPAQIQSMAAKAGVDPQALMSSAKSYIPGNGQFQLPDSMRNMVGDKAMQGVQEQMNPQGIGDKAISGIKGMFGYGEPEFGRGDVPDPYAGASDAAFASDYDARFPQQGYGDKAFNSVKNFFGGGQPDPNAGSSDAAFAADYDKRFPQEQGPSTWDKITGAVKGGAKSLVSGIQDNPNLANVGINALGAGGALLAQKNALKSQQDILGQQLEQARNMQTYEQQTPELYKELAAGGPTSKYAQEMMNTAKDAGQVAQAGRGAALERMSRMGRGGGELEAMLGGAQAGANRYSDASRDALMRDQDLRIGAADKMSAIDKFNVGQKQSTQADRINLEQKLRNQEQAYQGVSGDINSNAIGAIAGGATKGLSAASDASQKNVNNALAHEQAMELKYGRQPQPQLQPPPQPIPQPQPQRQQQAPIARPIQQAPAKPIVQPKPAAPAPYNGPMAAPVNAVNNTVNNAMKKLKNPFGF